MTFLQQNLELRDDAKATARRLHGRLTNVVEFLDKISSVLSEGAGQTVLAAIQSALPWAGAAVSVAGEALPPLKFVGLLLEGIVSEQDPHVLGYLACTLAYQRAVEQAVEATLKDARPSATVLKRALPRPFAETYRFDGFSLDYATKHQFFIDASSALEGFASGLGFGSGSPESLKLQREVRARFVPNLVGIVSHGKTRGEFELFVRLLQLGQPEQRLRIALLEHAETQRWLFEEAPVLGSESFALAEVYVEPACAVHTWREVHEAGIAGLARVLRSDITSAESVAHAPTPADLASGEAPSILYDAALNLANGGSADTRPVRRSLLSTVTALLADANYHEAVIVQGPAGAGKSTFTLRLCADLVASGLVPVRVELKHLDSRQGIRLCGAIPRALEIRSQVRVPNCIRHLPQSGNFEDEFLEMLDETVTFNGFTMCPYVLILDGLDELPLSGNHNFVERLKSFLAEVEETFLRRRDSKVRVVVVGRPTALLAETRFLKSATRIVTLSPWSPADLALFIQKLGGLQDVDRDLRLPATWKLPTAEVCARVVSEFSLRRNLAMLGSPLLAHLCLRLLGETAQTNERAMLEDLLESPGGLYRRMVDLVIEKAGKPSSTDFEPERSAMITGAGLRTLLQRTAEAMTVLGVENIRQGELSLRLELDATELDAHLLELEGRELVSRLLISFFFKGGHAAFGCEFAHKSFREYLFAERIVAILKRYGLSAVNSLSERDRDDYWRDFDESDPRHELSRSLVAALGPQWLSAEVSAYIRSLIVWEIETSRLEAPEDIGASGNNPLVCSTRRCSVQTWKRIRDGLADLWDWWGEGVMLRPQPRRKRGTKEHDWTAPLA